MYNTPLRYGSYVYPRWGKALGVCMGTTCCLQILIWAIVAISKETGTLKDVSTTSHVILCVCVRSSYTSATLTHNNTDHCCTWLHQVAGRWNEISRFGGLVIVSGFLFFSAFPEINSTSEFLEGKLEQCWESGGACGGSVHCHSHRHGLYCEEVGDGKPGVTVWRAAENTKE